MKSRHAPFKLILGALVSTAACGAPPEDDGRRRAAALVNASPVHKDELPGCSLPHRAGARHGGLEGDRSGQLFLQRRHDLRARGETVIESQVPPFESSAVRGTYLARGNRRHPGHDRGLQGQPDCPLARRARWPVCRQLATLRRPCGVADHGRYPEPRQPHRRCRAGPGPRRCRGRRRRHLGPFVRRFYPRPGDPTSWNRCTSSPATTWCTLQPRQPRRPPGHVLQRGRPQRRPRRRCDCSGGLWSNSSRIDLLDPLLLLPETVFALVSKDPLVPMPNDGLVSIDSAKWGTFLGCVPADHLDEIGQLLHLFPDAISGFDHKKLYGASSASSIT